MGWFFISPPSSTCYNEPMANDPRKISSRDIRVILFDLDDTLYPHDSGVWEFIRERIDQYMFEELHFPAEQIPGLRYRLWKQYGTTLRGLQAEFHVDMDAYLKYVHAVPLHDFLLPDPILSETLSALPQAKYIFTNSDAAHARRVLDHLGITHHFRQFIDIYAMAPHCKPQEQAFRKALEIVGCNPENCLLIDDSPLNLETALHLGINTISIGAKPHDGSPHIEKLAELLTLLN